MNILLVNDDGIFAPGLTALHKELIKFANVTVVAPAMEQSGASSSITIKDIVKVDEVTKNGKFFGYAVHGTPADAAKLGINELSPTRPDYIFSGINRGANISTHVNYSGTVAAAAEGPLEGITSVAVSLYNYDNCIYDPAAVMAARWLDIMENKDVPRGLLYNLNVPALPLDEIKGFAPTFLLDDPMRLTYERRKSPRGKDYFWIYGMNLPEKYEPDSDLAVLKQGYVSVTPLAKRDLTDYETMEILKKNL